MTKTIEALGEQLFVAYNQQGPNPWVTYDGKAVPRWADLNDQVRAKWCAVARASLESMAIIFDGLNEALGRMRAELLPPA